LSPFVAPIMLFAAALLAGGALWSWIRVQGSISLARIAVMELNSKVEQLDIRITREVKTRAGQTRTEAALDDKSILEQAHLLLDGNGAPAQPPGRPKRPYRGIR